MRIVFVVEGGGVGRPDAAFRRGIDQFLASFKARAREKGWEWQTVPGHARFEAYKTFVRQIKLNPGGLVLLLVDSEGPVDSDPWLHIGWLFTERKDHLHLMVQAMEAWYGRGFAEDALPKGAPEGYSPGDLMASLAKATNASSKGRYVKAHGHDLIGVVDPLIVAVRCPSAKAFFDHLDEILS